MILGGNVRVGLEDNLYLKRGVLASNGQLVERAVEIIERLGGNIVSPQQTREKLGLTKRWFKLLILDNTINYQFLQDFTSIPAMPASLCVFWWIIFFLTKLQAVCFVTLWKSLILDQSGKRILVWRCIGGVFSHVSLELPKLNSTLNQLKPQPYHLIRW